MLDFLLCSNYAELTQGKSEVKVLLTMFLQLDNSLNAADF